MQFFKKNKSKIMVTFVFVALMGLISATASSRGSLTGVESGMGAVIVPVKGVLYSASVKLSTGLGSIGDIFTLREENERLRVENAELKEQVLSYEDVIGKSDFLRQEYELRENSRYDFVAARVTGKDPGNWFERFTINKGSSDGIQAGDAVMLGVETTDRLVTEGLVGRVIEVGDTWAKVSSIVDIGNNVSFSIVRNRDGGVIRGNLEGGLEGYMFDTETDVTKGDKLVTSGIGGIYQEGLFIGEVSEVKKSSNDLLVHIEAKTEINFSKIHEVFVITGSRE